MRYDHYRPPLVCMQTQSSCYRGTGTMQPVGVLWHCTGANNPTLRRYVQPSDDAPDRLEWLARLGKNAGRNDWNHIHVDAGLNAWIGQLADGSVTAVQTMPWDYRPWGCGSGSRGSCNYGWIQFEVCEDDLTDPVYWADCYREAVELTAYLCQLYGIDPHGYVDVNGIEVPTILCHRDSAALALGSWHGDVYNWSSRYGIDMEDVCRDVAALMAGAEPLPQPEPSPEPEPAPQPEGEDIGLKPGDTVRIKPGSHYYKSDKPVPDWAVAKLWVVRAVDKHRVVLGESTDGRNDLNSPIRYDALELVAEGSDPEPEPAPDPQPQPEERPQYSRPAYWYDVKLPLLCRGMTHPAVAAAQALLAERGYLSGQIDAVYGEMTRRSVMGYQADHGLDTDGEIGGATWAALLEV